MDPLSIGIGLASGIGSLIGDLSEASAARKAKQDAIAAFKKLLIPSTEIEARADRAGDNIYTKTMSELNSGAFSTRGALNPETLKTIAYSKMGVARAEGENTIANQDYAYNKGIQQKIAGIESQPIPGINPFNAISEGIGGYLAGEQLGMQQDLIKSQKNYYDNLKNYGMDKTGDFGMTISNDKFNLLDYNPNLKKKKNPFFGNVAFK